MTAVLISLAANGQQVFKNYFDGEIYLKIKNETPYKFDTVHRDISISDKLPFLNALVEKYKIKRVEASFYFSKSEILQRTFRIHFDRKELVATLIADLQEMKQTEYAEKIPIMRTDYAPNDLGTNDNNGQYSLYQVHATEAWNVTQGSSNIIIAVVDNAMEISHSDLASNVVSSRDVADNDNDPSPPAGIYPNRDHGTHTCGIAGAATNNVTGIASLAFGCKLMAIKTMPDIKMDGKIYYGNEGITWAADNGAKVISCSFGGSASSSTQQNVINYAYSKDAIVVASAGNNNDNIIQYPAGCTHVLSVAATDINDTRAGFSTYGSWVTVSAPGVNIKSTVPGNAYDYESGTSMSCPLVASLCGLVRSLNPSLPYDNVVSCVVNTADNIDAQNPNFIGQLGSGRINAYRAVECNLPCNGSINLGLFPYSVLKTESSGSITSGNTIQNGTQVAFDAATKVILQAGFSAVGGSVFHAYVDGCGGAKMSNPYISLAKVETVLHNNPSQPKK